MYAARKLATGWAIVLSVATACSSPGERVSLDETDHELTLQGPGVGLVVAKDGARLTFRGGGEPVRGAEPSLFFSIGNARVALASFLGHSRSSDQISMRFSSPAGEAVLRVSFPLEGVARVEFTPPGAGAATAGLRLHSPPEEAIYGLMERVSPDVVLIEFVPAELGSLDRRGLKIPMRVANSVALYTPFFQTSGRYGLYVEGTAIGSYDLASTREDVIEMEFELPPGVRSWAFDFIAGPTHDGILDRYTALTGRPFLPPRSAFRHWRWRDEHRSAAPVQLDGVEMNADIVDDITHYEELDIPVGNYTIDRPWATGDLPDLTPPEEPGFGDLVWDEVRFPHPQQMVDVLNARGYRVFLWVAPWATGHLISREARERGYLAPGSRFIIDYTNPDATRWWTEKITPLVQMGFAGLKLDRADEDVPDSATDVYSDGRTGREMRNAYPILFAKVHHDIMRAVRGDDFLVYPRAGYAGSQQWAVFSAGDIPGRNVLGVATELGLRSAILAVQHNAFNGFPIWGSDTGGYAEFGDREVFARWIEFSAFCPIMEIGGVGSHAPWDMPTEPRYDEEMIAIYRFYVKLHHALIDYTYRHAQEAHRSGRPIAKPLVFNYPDDPTVKDLWAEFLYGDDILVAPVWRVGRRSQSVYLPKGRWVDFWNRARVLGGPAELEEPAPLDRIPIFVREAGEVLHDLPAE